LKPSGNKPSNYGVHTNPWLHHGARLALAGDGGTFDLGLQGLSAAAERNEDIIFICYNNEAYMNTGMQRSSASP
jgi:pyruvate/2-oxoacid:ferredoxin oxidoreductase beta subunit